MNKSNHTCASQAFACVIFPNMLLAKANLKAKTRDRVGERYKVMCKIDGYIVYYGLKCPLQNSHIEVLTSTSSDVTIFLEIEL